MGWLNAEVQFGYNYKVAKIHAQHPGSVFSGVAGAERAPL
jgi:hypothetical protein